MGGAQVRPDDADGWSGLPQRRRVRRMLREMERLDRTWDRAPKSSSQKGRGSVRVFSAVLVGIATSAVGVAVLADRSADMIHDGVWTMGEATAGWPSKPLDVSDEPRGMPPVVAGTGTFEFLATQDGSSGPVAYSPCQPIHLVVNARTAIPGHKQILHDAVAEVSRVSGLEFVFDGETDRVPEQRAPRPASDGHGWEPVLVAWSDDGEVPELAGDVAGIGGSARASRGGRAWLVTGNVVIDGVDAARMMQRPNGAEAVKAVILHELGHLLGLDHVQDRSELMYERNIGQASYGPGDSAGLAMLGSGECVDW